MKQMKENIKYSHMRVAEEYAQLSYCERLKVGSIAVKDDRIISIGYNGTPSGWENVCEIDGVTKPEVLHSEANLLMKLAKCSESAEGASVFITHAPCIECAKLLYQSGIVSVYYRNKYRDESGIKFLKKCKIHVERLKDHVI